MTAHPHSSGPGDGPRVRLAPHRDSDEGSVHLVEVRAVALCPDVMDVEFTLIGDLSVIRIPPSGPGRRAEELWRHTCFEAFVRRDDEPGYLEFNFSPSGAWQAYQFSGYRRDRQPAALPAPPDLTVRQPGSASRAVTALILEARVHLPASFRTAPGGLRLALSAVVEAGTGTLSYWALRHAPGRPDFHHPDAFALTLAGS